MKESKWKQDMPPKGTRNICKWYPVCPLKRFYENGLIDEHWVRDYCFGDDLECIRYRMEERGIFHPDNMLPDGSIDENLPE